jgi:hypothetical protein
MAYSVCKHKKGWRVIWQEGGGKKRAFKKSEFGDTGFANCKTIEQAREVAKTLNSDIKLKREETKRNALLARQAKEDLLTCAALPPAFRVEFEKVFVPNTIRASHWETAKKIIRNVGVAVGDWETKKELFYEQFAGRHYSTSYSNRIRIIVNKWASFLGKKTGMYVEHVPAARGTWANRIRRAYETHNTSNKNRRRRPSGRLSFELLNEHKERFEKAEYNWLFISIAFGLRPEEMEFSLRTAKKWVRKDDALFVYQPKLERTEPNPKKRWKKIPFKTEEQKTAIKMIMSGEFRKPGVKKMRKIVDNHGRKVTYYGGRKEFYPSMGKRFEKADVSKWLGHKNLETAFSFYDDPEDDDPFSEVA